MTDRTSESMDDDDNLADARPLGAEPIDAHFEPAPTARPRRSGPNWLSLALASLLAALAGATISLIAGRLNGAAPATLVRDVRTLKAERDDLALQITALESQLAALQTSLGGEDFAGVIADIETVSKRIDESLLAGDGPKSLNVLDRRLAAMEAADTSGPLTQRQTTRSLAALETRLAVMEEALARTRTEAGGVDTLAVRVTQAEATLEALRRSPASGTAAPVVTDGLSAVLSDMRTEEARAREAARRSADNADAALALASIERASLRGASFESDYRALRALRPASPAIRQLGQVASLGAPTSAALKADFVKAERAARKTISTEADKGLGWMKALFGDAVRVRSKDGSEGASVALDDARAAMTRDDLASAVAAINGLPGETGLAVADWTESASRRLMLDGALDAAREELLSDESARP